MLLDSHVCVRVKLCAIRPPCHMIYNSKSHDARGTTAPCCAVCAAQVLGRLPLQEINTAKMGGAKKDVKKNRRKNQTSVLY